MMTVNRNLGTYALKLFRKIFMDMPLGIRMRNSSTLLLLIKILLTNKYVIENLTVSSNHDLEKVDI